MTPLKRSKNPLKHYPKKSLGQNFLINPWARDKIIEACGFTDKDIVLEIGPGKGVLTENIFPRVKELTVVERDGQLADMLAEKFGEQSIDIIRGDILNYSLKDYAERIKVVGNIPYNISTPIIEHLLAQRDKIQTFFMTVQLEFGRRLAAVPGNKDYGSLTCFAQFYADIKLLFQIKNTSFFPVPKVQSCFVEMRFLDKPRFSIEHEEDLFRFIQLTFTKRRKTILNALPADLAKEDLQKILQQQEIDSKLRPENISLENYVKIYKAIKTAEKR